ncbi:MAG: glycerol-3-phosphate acyltransferase [Anaerolineae bacterium]
MDVIAWILVAFLSGSIPFAVLVGRLAGCGDIRQYGDHNPGATNVLRAAGIGWFALALLLDVLKGALPVGLAWLNSGLEGWRIVPVALAALVGHGWSPWLGGRGGKMVATTFGIWAGLTLGAGPIVLGCLLGLMFGVLSTSAWATCLSMLTFGGFVGWVYADYRPELLAVWLGNLVLVAWRHRVELGHPPQVRARWLHALGRTHR